MQSQLYLLPFSGEEELHSRGQYGYNYYPCIITSHIEDNNIDLFKLGFVGNGEPMLDYEKLKQYTLILAII